MRRGATPLCRPAQQRTEPRARPLERRHTLLVLAFALGCLLSSAYGFLSGTWPFGVVGALWSAIAVVRFVKMHRAPTRSST